MSIEDSNPARDPHAFARLVATASADELKQLMTGDQRAAVLDEIFTHMPDVFRADRAGSTDAVVHWRVTGRPDGGADTYELVIAGGACELSHRPDRQPRLTLTLGPVDFIKVVTGNASPIMLFMRGKMKAKGDLGLATKIPDLFDPPTG